MPQHDYTIANAPGATVRADINNVLQAILSQNSGPTAPTDTIAYMIWVDTTSQTHKQRNSTDSAWIILHKIESTITHKDDIGANIPSAATVDLSTATGKTITVTGSVAITSFGTVDAGFNFTLVFSSTPVITHNVTSLILPGGANITAAAGDVMQLVSLGSGNWRVTNYTRADGDVVGPGSATTNNIVTFADASGNVVKDSGIPITATGKVLQVVTTSSALLQTTSNLIPYDDTIPQITEGAQMMTLSITPINASSTFIIEAIGFASSRGSSSELPITMALFESAESPNDALAAVGRIAYNGSNSDNDYGGTLSLSFSVVSGNNTNRTYKIRMGRGNAGTLTFNGENVARLYGATPKSSMKITEVL